MEQYMVWVWLIVFILMLILEFATSDFLTIWFALSAIPTVLIAAIWPEFIWLQVLVFFLFGFLLMFIIRKYVVKYFKKNIVDTNIDTYIGKTAIVTKEITSTSRGLVHFENDTWTAISSEDIEIDSVVKILAIEGNKFIVTKIEKGVK